MNSLIFPDVFPFSVGHHRGWILHDGDFLMPATAIAQGATHDQLVALVGDDLRADHQLQLSVNVMLLEWDRDLILVDTGCGASFGPGLGKMMASLRTAGFEAGNVTMVLFTHLHLDHLAGAVDFVTQKVNFPRARFFAQREEVDYWQQVAPDLTGTALPLEQRRAMVDGIHGALSLLGARLELFAPGERLAEGILAVPLPGHTLAHTGFLVQADGESLLNSGDAMIDPRLHVPHPEWSQVGDASQMIAAATRRALCRWIDHDSIRLFGSHFKFPGFERIDTLRPRANPDSGLARQRTTGNSHRETSLLIQ